MIPKGPFDDTVTDTVVITLKETLEHAEGLRDALVAQFDAAQTPAIAEAIAHIDQVIIAASATLIQHEQNDEVVRLKKSRDGFISEVQLKDARIAAQHEQIVKLTEETQSLQAALDTTQSELAKEQAAAKQWLADWDTYTAEQRKLRSDNVVKLQEAQKDLKDITYQKARGDCHISDLKRSLKEKDETIEQLNLQIAAVHSITLSEIPLPPDLQFEGDAVPEAWANANRDTLVGAYQELAWAFKELTLSRRKLHDTSMNLYDELSQLRDEKNTLERQYKAANYLAEQRLIEMGELQSKQQQLENEIDAHYENKRILRDTIQRLEHQIPAETPEE